MDVRVKNILVLSCHGITDVGIFFLNIRLGKEPDEKVDTYFLPKLTEEELELVEKRDISYLQSFTAWSPDVYETEMKRSESDSKYVEGRFRRETFVIKNSFKNSLKNNSSLQ